MLPSVIMVNETHAYRIGRFFTGHFQVHLVTVCITTWPTIKQAPKDYWWPKIPSDSKDVRCDLLEDVRYRMVSFFFCGLLLVLVNLHSSGIYDSHDGCSGARVFAFCALLCCLCALCDVLPPCTVMCATIPDPENHCVASILLYA